MTNKHSQHSGFSLIQMAIILTIIAVLAASFLPGGNTINRAAQIDVSSKRMVAIENAIRGWRAANKRLPCPADGTLSPTDIYFGLEAANIGACTDGTPTANFGPSGNVVAGIVPVRTLGLSDDYAVDGYGRRFTYAVDLRATTGGGGGSDTPLPNPVNLVDDSSQVSSPDPQVYVYSPAHGLANGATVDVEGAIDFANVAASDMNGTHTVTVLDADDFSYSVPYAGLSCPASELQSNDPDMETLPVCTCLHTPSCAKTIPNSDLLITTSGSSCTANVGGSPGIIIKGDAPDDTAMFAIISHGANGHGAFPAKGSEVAARINSGSTDPDELENASVDASFNVNFNATFKKKAATPAFDDIVVYGKHCE